MVQLQNFLYSSLAVAGLAAVGYLIYFDQKRMNDPAFRKKLRRQRREAEKSRQAYEAKQSKKTSGAPIDLEALAAEPVPASPEEREKYFIKQLSTGDELVQKGPMFFEAAAACYFRALKIWPDPMQLLMALEQSCPPPVFNTIMEMMAADVRKEKEKQAKRPTEDDAAAQSEE
ncbi:hypothetical protein HK102_001614 [Quaeritorhiza haematococci]|nr:hypothetical protein HK102_001614 [Quaeritorhiza haematococci]